MSKLKSSALTSSAVLKNGSFATVWKEVASNGESWYRIVWASDCGRTLEKIAGLKRHADRFLKDRGVAYTIKGHFFGAELKDLATGTVGVMVGICHLSGDFILELEDGCKVSVSPLQCKPA